MDRREFCKIAAGLVVPLLVKPVRPLLPPRAPFVSCAAAGTEDIYLHLGIFPYAGGDDIDKGHLLEIEDWDGTGYPCLIEDTRLTPKGRTYIYDFDLYSIHAHPRFALTPIPNTAFSTGCWIPSHIVCLHQRFGENAQIVAMTGGGKISRTWEHDRRLHRAASRISKLPATHTADILIFDNKAMSDPT